jgi:hypothetical protein
MGATLVERILLASQIGLVETIRHDRNAVPATIGAVSPARAPVFASRSVNPIAERPTENLRQLAGRLLAFSTS